jgi:hypothetical protein
MTASDEQASRPVDEAGISRGSGTGAPVGLVVTLADVDPKQVEAVAAVIRQLDGVVSVQPVEADAAAQITRERVNAEWRHHIVDLLNDEGV